MNSTFDSSCFVYTSVFQIHQIFQLYIKNYVVFHQHPFFPQHQRPETKISFAFISSKINIFSKSGKQQQFSMILLMFVKPGRVDPWLREFQTDQPRICSWNKILRVWLLFFLFFHWQTEIPKAREKHWERRSKSQNLWKK